MAAGSDSVLTNFLINLVIWVVCFVTFDGLRNFKCLKKFYDPHRYSRRTVVKPKPISYRFMGWIWPVLTYSEPDIIDEAGLDAALYLRLLKLGRTLFFLLSIWCLATVLPANLSGNEVNSLLNKHIAATTHPFPPPPTPPSPPPSSPLSNHEIHRMLLSSSSGDYSLVDDGYLTVQSSGAKKFKLSDFDKFSLTNIAAGSKLMWVHVASMYFVTLVTLSLLYQYSRDSVTLRLMYLANKTRGGSSFTVLVSDIPGIAKMTKALAPTQKETRPLVRGRFSSSDPDFAQVDMLAAEGVGSSGGEGARREGEGAGREGEGAGREGEGTDRQQQQQQHVPLPISSASSASAAAVATRSLPLSHRDLSFPSIYSSASFTNFASSSSSSSSIASTNSLADTAAAASPMSPSNLDVPFGSGGGGVRVEDGNKKGTNGKDKYVNNEKNVFVKNSKVKNVTHNNNSSNNNVSATPTISTINALTEPSYLTSIPANVLRRRRRKFNYHLEEARELDSSLQVERILKSGVTPQVLIESMFERLLGRGSVAAVHIVRDTRRLEPLVKTFKEIREDVKDYIAECNLHLDEIYPESADAVIGGSGERGGSGGRGMGGMHRMHGMHGMPLPSSLSPSSPSPSSLSPSPSSFPPLSSHPHHPIPKKSFALKTSLLPPPFLRNLLLPPDHFRRRAAEDLSPRLSRAAACCCHLLQRVDTLDLQLAHMRVLRTKIKDEQSSAFDRPTSSAFVTFRRRVSQCIASGALMHHDLRTWRVCAAPEPGDVRWRPLRWPAAGRATGRVAFWILFWSLTISSFAPIAAIQALINVAAYGHISHVRQVVVRQLLEAFAPGLALKLFLMLVPVFLSWMVRTTGAHSGAEVDFKVVQSYFLFQVVVVFLGSVIAGSFFNQLREWLASPASVLEVLGAAVPMTATFFVTYLIISGLGMKSITLLRLPALLVYAVLHLAKGSPRARERLWSLQLDNYGSKVADHSITLLLGLVYCCVNPIVCPAALAYYLVTTATEGYQIIYVTRQKHDGGGQLWKNLLHQVMVGLYFAQISLLGLLSIKKFPFSPLLLIPLIASVVFHASVSSSYSKPWSHVALCDAMDLDEEDERARVDHLSRRRGGGGGGEMDVEKREEEEDQMEETRKRKQEEVEKEQKMGEKVIKSSKLERKEGKKSVTLASDGQVLGDLEAKTRKWSWGGSKATGTGDDSLLQRGAGSVAGGSGGGGGGGGVEGEDEGEGERRGQKYDESRSKEEGEEGGEEAKDERGRSSKSKAKGSKDNKNRNSRKKGGNCERELTAALSPADLALGEAGGEAWGGLNDSVGEEEGKNEEEEEGKNKEEEERGSSADAVTLTITNAVDEKNSHPRAEGEGSILRRLSARFGSSERDQRDKAKKDHDVLEQEARRRQNEQDLYNLHLRYGVSDEDDDWEDRHGEKKKEKGREKGKERRKEKKKSEWERDKDDERDQTTLVNSYLSPFFKIDLDVIERLEKQVQNVRRRVAALQAARSAALVFSTAASAAIDENDFEGDFERGGRGREEGGEKWGEGGKGEEGGGREEGGI